MSNSFERLTPRRRGLVLLACAAGACTALAAGSAQASGTTPSTLPSITLSVSSSSITVGGTLKSGAVNVVSTTAAGLKEPSTVLFLLKPGVSVSEVYEYLNADKTGDPNTATKYGSIVFDASGEGGKSTEAQTMLAAGTYIALNAEGEKSVKWPRTSFVIAANPAPAVLPAAQATEKTIDFAFRGPTTLSDGEVVRFENEGYVVHMDIAAPVKSKRNGEKLVKALLAGKEKQAEKLIAGEPASFAGPLSTGGFQQETITAKPGWYVQVCFMETQDGRDHTRLGMERMIKINK
jgi:hypothetical protein